jgi:hypothetical protein
MGLVKHNVKVLLFFVQPRKKEIEVNVCSILNRLNLFLNIFNLHFFLETKLRKQFS